MNGPSLPRFQFDDGSALVADRVAVPEQTPFDGWSEDDLKGFIATLWHDAYEAKRPETARLQRNSCYYDGFHYTTATQNQTNAIENHCWRIVEVQVANTVAASPRPEIRPGAWASTPSTDPNRVEPSVNLQAFATWLMDRDFFDHSVNLGARDKRIYGWNVWLCSIDYKTGMPVPICQSVFDTYWDPAGRNEEECGYFILAGPQPTARLRATFPDHAEEITSDGFASPAYEAVVRPWYEFLETAGFAHPEAAPSVLAVHPESETPSTGVTLVNAPAERMEHGQTTFVIQVLVRDEGVVEACFYGTLYRPDGPPLPAQKHHAQIPRSKSGWWLLSMTAGGILLEEPREYDDCFLGLPLVFDRVAQRTDRFVSLSDLDQAIPIQRGNNRSNELLDHNLEIVANPPIVSDTYSRLRAQLNNGPIEGGELLEVARGSDVKPMQFTGLDARHFERQRDRLRAMQSVTGVQDAIEGAAPERVQAAAAIRQLSGSAKQRLIAGESEAGRAREILLRKLMHAAGRKLQQPMRFRGMDGKDYEITQQELLMDYTVRIAQGTGTVEASQDLEDKAVALFDRQAIDVQALLDTFRWPNAEQIALRVQQNQERLAYAQAAGAAVGGKEASGSQPSGGEE